jgi:hypothetical protein
VSKGFSPVFDTWVARLLNVGHSLPPCEYKRLAPSRLEIGAPTDKGFLGTAILDSPDIAKRHDCAWKNSRKEPGRAAFKPRERQERISYRSAAVDPEQRAPVR